MSTSKLESLPNEILIDLFEKYIDGIDILVGFDSLNSRFDDIIQSCPRFSLDFRHCRRANFRSCLKSLRNDRIGKVVELILSEQNTPGQIERFVTSFPSLAEFKQLKKLQLHNLDVFVYSSQMIALVRSLSATPIETISINLIGRDYLSEQIKNLFDVCHAPSTLKRVVITDIQAFSKMFAFPANSSAIEYLKCMDDSSDSSRYSPFFSYGSHLKYLNVQYRSTSFSTFRHLFNRSQHQSGPMTLLHTLILNFPPGDLMSMDVLTNHLRLLSLLQRLEITATELILDANVWQEFLQTSLPLLMHFRLKSTTSHIRIRSIDIILASFETPFWVSKDNFYLIITEHRRINCSEIYLPRKSVFDKNELSQPTVRWWIVPTRARIDDKPTRDITSFGMTSAFKYLSDYYYFQNIKHLFIYDLDASLVQYLSRSINCIGIKHLDVSSFNHQSNAVPLLLSELNHVISLRISYRHLVDCQDVYSAISKFIKYLDISVVQHQFSEVDIIMISRLFPQLNHLAVNSEQILDISLMKIHLPNLWSLTYDVDGQGCILRQNDESHDERSSRLELRYQWKTIWIDDDTLNEVQ